MRNSTGPPPGDGTEARDEFARPRRGSGRGPARRAHTWAPLGRPGDPLPLVTIFRGNRPVRVLYGPAALELLIRVAFTEPSRNSVAESEFASMHQTLIRRTRTGLWLVRVRPLLITRRKGGHPFRRQA